MAQVEQLVNELKHYLKSRNITYADVAARIELSESSVKRLFARCAFSLRRLEQVCNAVDIEISDLFQMLESRREYLTELSMEQEQALVAEPKLLLLTYLLINGWSLPDITASFQINETEIQSLLIRLHRARIIELLPLNRVRLRTARNFAWRPKGPVQTLLAKQVQREFFDSTFSGTGARLRFVGGLLSRASLLQMQQAIDRLAREFDDLARRDATLPLAERHACGAVLAVRPWEFSVFVALKRERREVASGGVP
jgi:DNA-binding Xre family transcriptional regulator